MEIKFSFFSAFPFHSGQARVAARALLSGPTRQVVSCSSPWPTPDNRVTVGEAWDVSSAAMTTRSLTTNDYCTLEFSRCIDFL